MITHVGNVTIGTDVEFFVEDGKGTIVSAETLIPGTKDKPFKLAAHPEGFATQLDNVLAEGNIPPTRTSYQFHQYIKYLRNQIDSILPTGLHTAAIASARLEDKYLSTEHARTFGCDPALNCWTERYEEVKPTDLTLRAGGFHIHVGYEEPEPDINFMLARMLDLYLGVPSILLEPKNDRRRVGYGKAGNMRHQPHGVEYRTLSSYMASTEKLITWAFNNTIAAIAAHNAGKMLTGAEGDLIQKAINSEDHVLARVLLSTYGVPVA